MPDNLVSVAVSNFGLLLSAYLKNHKEREREEAKEKGSAFPHYVTNKDPFNQGGEKNEIEIIFLFPRKMAVTLNVCGVVAGIYRICGRLLNLM